MMPLERRGRSPSRRQGAGPLITLAVVVLVPALALFAVWRFAAGREGEATSDTTPPTTAPPATPAAVVPPLPTPLLSYRRVAPLFAPGADVAAFTAPVTDFGNTLDGTSCVLVAVDGVEAGSHNPDLPVIPASNQKLLTAAAALQILGPDYTFTTTVSATGFSGGVVSGDLYLVGGGDPLLRTPDWDGTIIGYPLPDEATDLNVLAQSIVDAGVTQIQGRVLGDGSRYDDQLFHEEWGDDVRVLEAGPLSALMVNDSRLDEGGEWDTADSPTGGAAAELTRMLRALGVTVVGEPGSGAAPADAAAVTSIQSAPLPVVIAEMLGTSDNNTAELLVKEMGLQVGGEGTTAAGTAAMTAALQQLGIDTTPFVIADGSGLSNQNRVTCRGLASVLMRHEPGDDLAAGLPVAGESGTLSDNFLDTPMAGVLQAKTGSLSNPPFNDDIPSVKALAGYVPLDEGGTIQFALVLNSPTTDYAQIVNNEPIWARFAELLAGYTPSGPTAADLGPVTGE